MSYSNFKRRFRAAKLIGEEAGRDPDVRAVDKKYLLIVLILILRVCTLLTVWYK